MTQAYWISALANHLWQSTAVVVAAWLLAFALRNNQARTRYWIWLTASLKFLIPFSLFIEIGQRIGSMAAAPIARPSISQAMSRIDRVSQMSQSAQSFLDAQSSSLATISRHNSLLLQIAVAVWAFGAILLALSWARNWWRLCSAVRAGSPLPVQAGVPVLSSSSQIEPGIFGIFRPVMMLPKGIADRLNSAQMQAIVAHEMCHVRRRDNLTFALHMAVETIFWFHPLVWWLRTRLIEERERACDEAVLQSGSEAEVYAEGILNVCKFYVESPLACASGVTGSDLKQRIVRIMSEQLGSRLGLGRKLLLAAIAFIAVLVPVTLGFAHTTEIFAQTKVQAEAGAGVPEFEVATIKPNKAGGNRRSFMYNETGMSMEGVPVQMMLQDTFDITEDRILGVPNWVKTDLFDVEAKVSTTDAPKLDHLTMEQRRFMLQSLLAERFNLKYHHETKELPVYTLVIAKGGLKLKQNPAGGEHEQSGIRMSGRGDFEGMNANMLVLCHVLSEQPELSHTIIDKTGLTGSFDFHLQWTPEIAGPSGPDANSAGAPAPDSNKPSLFTALQEQLGLKLEPQKGPVDVIVIDHIDKPSAD
jgi:bla regulator protein BlaR1